ncbi:MAG: hypothetical protein B6244_02130 [Candidatus Cloacimonetes bacterium 4572_55]|nr:MAG: hypothetical protein B6244_02130 [Candidatus Cloacimonetes bacterium 4572_55]
MTCEICKKNKAIRRYTEIVNDKKTVIHICEECATKNGVIDSITLKKTKDEKEARSGEQEEKVKGKLEKQLIVAVSDLFKRNREKIKCGTCDMTLQDFQKEGRLGCPDCYQTFGGFLKKIFQEFHDSTHHEGKQPITFNSSQAEKLLRRQREIDILKKQMDQAVSTESFEKAAELRDMIKKLDQAAG